MKTLTNLTAEPVETNYQERHGIFNNVHEEPARGFFRVAALSAGGLLLKRGGVEVVIPLPEIWKLVTTHEPRLAPPSPGGEGRGEGGQSPS